MHTLLWAALTLRTANAYYLTLTCNCAVVRARQLAMLSAARVKMAAACYSCLCLAHGTHPPCKSKQSADRKADNARLTRSLFALRFSFFTCRLPASYWQRGGVSEWVDGCVGCWRLKSLLSSASALALLLASASASTFCVSVSANVIIIESIRFDFFAFVSNASESLNKRYA